MVWCSPAYPSLPHHPAPKLNKECRSLVSHSLHLCVSSVATGTGLNCCMSLLYQHHKCSHACTYTRVLPSYHHPLLGYHPSWSAHMCQCIVAAVNTLDTPGIAMAYLSNTKSKLVTPRSSPGCFRHHVMYCVAIWTCSHMQHLL